MALWRGELPAGLSGWRHSRRPVEWSKHVRRGDAHRPAHHQAFARPGTCAETGRRGWVWSVLSWIADNDSDDIAAVGWAPDALEALLDADQALGEICGDICSAACGERGHV